MTRTTDEGAAQVRSEGRALFRGARRLGRQLLTETGDAHRALEQLAMTLVQERTPAQLGGALAAAALDAVMDDAASDTPARPRVVVLCGSTRFRDAFHEVNQRLTLSGAIVLAPGVFGHADGVQLSDEVKAKLDALHLRKIDAADQVVVVNPGGYIGESTRNEIAYAEQAGKRIDYWYGDPTTDQDFTTAGQPHPVAAARAQAAAEQLPTVGRWPGTSPAADPWYSQPTTRLFLVHASGTVEEIDGGGDIAGGWSAPGLYERLLLAGFPLTRDDHAKNFDGLIDVGTDGTRVVAHASDGPRDMGGAEAELFLDWFRRAAA